MIDHSYSVVSALVRPISRMLKKTLDVHVPRLILLFISSHDLVSNPEHVKKR